MRWEGGTVAEGTGGGTSNRKEQRKQPRNSCISRAATASVMVKAAVIARAKTTVATVTPTGMVATAVITVQVVAAGWVVVGAAVLATA